MIHSDDNDLQVPASSSPLKQDDSTQSIKDRFNFKPAYGSGSSRPSGSNTNMGASGDRTLNALIEEFSDFSPTLVQAVFKSNAFDYGQAQERLSKIRNQRGHWASSKEKRLSPSKPRSDESNATIGSDRLDSLNSKSGSKMSQYHPSAPSTSKIIVEKQRTSIFDRYSSVIHSKQRNLNNDPNYKELLETDEEDSPIKARPKRRKLVRGDAFQKTTDIKPTKIDEAVNDLRSRKLARKLMENEGGSEDENISFDDDEDASADNYEEKYMSINIDNQILEFLNTASALDIVDIAEVPLEKAETVIARRPFSNLQHFMEMDFIPEASSSTSSAKAKKKSSNKKDGDRMYDKMAQSIRGYNAIESLLKKCSQYGELLSKQMSKWGVSIDHDNKKVELDFIDIGSDDDAIAVVDNFEKSDDTNNKTESTGFSLSERPSKRDKGDEDNESDGEYQEEENYLSSDNDEDFIKPRIKSKSDNLNNAKVVKFFRGKPKLLSPDVTLKDYQQTGINWLNLLYQNNISGILADDMGLGKTCQVISFFAYLKQINEPGPHLVVVPSSTLENWLREFQKFCPSLKIEPYYGSQQERADLRDILEENHGNYDVVVTTYNLASGNKYDVSFLKSRNFNVVVYDEGHMLKNSMSERFSKLMRIHAHFRLLLTGTPLQNNLRELMSLLEFIMPSLFVSKKESLAMIFKQRAKTTDDNKGHNPLIAQQAIERAQTMMKPFILRRHKDQVLKHLPAKHKHVEYSEMTPAQRKIYLTEIENVKKFKNGTLKLDEKGKKLGNITKNLIMSLRKASIHPLLFRSIYTDSTIKKMSKAILREPEYCENGNQQYIMEDMGVMTDFELHKLCCNFPKSLGNYQLKNKEWMESGKIITLRPILAKIIDERKEKVLIFSLFTQVLDILEYVLSTLGYKFLRLDGSTQVNDRQTMIDKFYDDKTIPIFILSTKAGGFGINLVCANNVIIFDQSFNPHDDKQAADRAHRVGQTKEVNITTIIMKDSIEEKIHQMASHKLALDNYVSGGSGEADSKEGSVDINESTAKDLLEELTT